MDPLLRDALSRLDRGVLMPLAYIRRSEPVGWELLDGAHPEDRAERQDLVYSGESVLVQRDGDTVSKVAFGAAHGDPELVERDRRTLARVRSEHRSCNSLTGESP
ncbi:hypothetical protein [Streptomyces sp. NPDC102437]|uniref:hypothetical protein n=1 Tax=Streptomyces sp. NPDC102437 TaxID=3366175 RepID=UPI0037F24927